MSIKREWIWNSGGLQQCFRCYSEEWGQSQVECMQYELDDIVKRRLEWLS